MTPYFQQIDEGMRDVSTHAIALVTLSPRDFAQRLDLSFERDDHDRAVVALISVADRPRAERGQVSLLR